MMRLPVRLTPQHPGLKVLVAILIAAGATALGVVAHHLPGVSARALSGLDNTLYDAFYHFRKPQDRSGGPIVILAVDETTKAKMSTRNYTWPFQRSIWAVAIPYLQMCGAKVIVFDITFKDPAGFDMEFGKALDAASMPVVLGSMFNADGKPDAFAPKVQKPPSLGAVNLLDDKVEREYQPFIYGRLSLAVQAARAAGATIPPWANAPFRMHFYGPYVLKNGHTTYNYVPALRVFLNSFDSSHKQLAADSELFRDKIVIFGVTAQGLFDLEIFARVRHLSRRRSAGDRDRQSNQCPACR